MVCHRNGYWWSFPKGHSEPNERPEAAATRELREETGLEVARLLGLSPLTEFYVYRRHGEPIAKRNTYFLAEVEGQLQLQDEELVDARWIALNQAETQATYPEAKAICRSVVRCLAEAPTQG
jgi:8-oxo-dGTP pyrophosphatase MutT (NUDIX family)